MPFCLWKKRAIKLVWGGGVHSIQGTKWKEIQPGLLWNVRFTVFQVSASQEEHISDQDADRLDDKSPNL